MATYTDLLSSIDSVFASDEWGATNVPAYPNNFTPKKIPNEFVRYEVIASGKGEREYGESDHKSGVIICQIFVPTNEGPRRLYELADVLKGLLARKIISSTQVYDGILSIQGADKDDPSLFRADYSLTFNSF